MKVIVNMVVDGNGVKIMLFVILILVCLSLVKKDSRYPALIDLVNLNSSNAIFTIKKLKTNFKSKDFLMVGKFL